MVVKKITHKVKETIKRSHHKKVVPPPTYDPIPAHHEPAHHETPMTSAFVEPVTPNPPLEPLSCGCFDTCSGHDDVAPEQPSLWQRFWNWVDKT